MKSQNIKSSDELQREVQQELKNVNRDIDTIQGRLSPGRIIDDAIFYNHGRSPAAILDHLKRNPVGTTFLSLGTLLLMEDESHTTYETSAKNKISSAKDTASSQASKVKSKFSDSVHTVKDSFDSKVSEIKQGLEVRAHRKEIKETFLNSESNSEGYSGMDVGETSGAQSKLKNVKDKLFEGKEKLSAGLSHSKEKFSTGLSSGKEKFQHMDNTTFMALGAGLGVLTGASLPVSEAEERMVNDKLQGRLSDFNTELREAMNECSNILKDLVVSDVKDYSMKIF